MSNKTLVINYNEVDVVMKIPFTEICTPLFGSDMRNPSYVILFAVMES